MSRRPGAPGRPAALAVALLLALAVALSGPLTSAATAGAPRASYNQIVGDLMCTVCHEPLAVAQSPEAFQERGVVRTLIGQGETRAQVERNMVAAYGAAVLALPPAHGFNLLVYVVPPVLLAVGVVTLLIAIPKWRRRTRLAASDPTTAASVLDAGDARRLDEDLARGA
ncbi:MAG TPA: cytochrome c-type biogenesis protein CcmH [Solirubrobacteraceae bacterium]